MIGMNPLPGYNTMTTQVPMTQGEELDTDDEVR
jgi:hypothetical protein